MLYPCTHIHMSSLSTFFLSSPSPSSSAIFKIYLVYLLLFHHLSLCYLFSSFLLYSSPTSLQRLQILRRASNFSDDGKVSVFHMANPPHIPCHVPCRVGSTRVRWPEVTSWSNRGSDVLRVCFCRNLSLISKRI